MSSIDLSDLEQTIAEINMEASSLPAAIAPSELDILKILWSRGRSSAREVHQAIAASSGWAYSTTRTTLDRMVPKGLVHKRPFHGINLFEAAITRPQGLAQLVRDFAHRVLETDPGAVVPLFTAGANLSAAEILELERLIDAQEARERTTDRAGRHE